MRRDEWLAGFCERLGLEPPSNEEVVALLDLAATAAHSSERTAAPLACWVAGRSDRSLAELGEIAKPAPPPRSPPGPRLRRNAASGGGRRCSPSPPLRDGRRRPRRGSLRRAEGGPSRGTSCPRARPGIRR